MGIGCGDLSRRNKSNYFLIRSTVLGGKVLAEFKDLSTMAENDPQKYDSKSYVYLKGVQLGYQQAPHSTTAKNVVWTYHNPTVGNYFAETQLNNSSGQQVNYSYGEMIFDPTGSYVGISQPLPLVIPAPFTFVSGQYMEPSGKCYADYVETPCTVIQKMLNNGTGQHAPWDPTATVYNPITKKNQLALFTVDWDNGFFGFVPTGAKYNGDGSWSWRSSTGRPTLNPRGTYERRYGRTYYPEQENGRLNKFFEASLGLTNGQQKQDGSNKVSPLAVVDDAGRNCLPSEIASIYLKNRTVGLTTSIVPHTWLQVPSGSWGFGPDKMQREGPGRVHDNSDPTKYYSDLTIRYAACPESVVIVEKAIKDNSSGWYVYSNRPEYVEHIGLRLWNERTGDLFEIYKYYDRAGYNCIGWACRVLETAGFTPPVPSSRPGIYPLHPKR